MVCFFLFFWQGVKQLERIAEYKALISSARDAAQFSYSPYSKVAQGAALLTVDGKTYKGAKMECAAYGGSVSAGTVALTTAVSEGERNFKAIAMYPSEYPCGSTRQMLAEFGIDLDVVVEDEHGEVSVVNLRNLLPSHFGPDNLK